MDRWEGARVAERGSGRKFHEMLTLEDLDYHNYLVGWVEKAKPTKVGKMPERWSDADYWARERFPAIKRAFAERGEGRKKVKTMKELDFDYAKWGCNDA